MPDPGLHIKQRHVPPGGAIAALLWLVAAAFAFSNAGTGLLFSTALFFWAIVWGGAWLVRCGAWRSSVRAGKRPPMPPGRARLYWGLEPAVFLLSVLLVHGGVFAQARFYLSQPALHDYVEGVRAGRVPPSRDRERPRTVGLYAVQRTELLPGGAVRIVTCDTGMGDHAGFAYAPSGKPPRLGEDSYTRIGGPWWFWYESW